MSDIASILNAFGVGSSDASQLVNPGYLDANGNPVQGQLPYQKPGFGTKLLNPNLASYIGQQNANYSLAPGLAAQQHNIFLNQGAKDYQEIQPQLNNDDQHLSPRSAAILSEGHYTPGVLSGINQNAADRTFNNPMNTAAYKASTSLEGIRKANAGLSANLPEAQVGAELAQAGYQKPFYQAQTNLIQPQNTYDLHKIASMESVLPSQTEATIAQNKAAIPQAQVSTETAQRQLAIKEQLDTISTLTANGNVEQARVELAKAQASGLLAPEQVSTLINQINTAKNQSQVGLGMSEQERKNLPAAQVASGNLAKMAAFHSRYREQIPYAGTTIDTEGNITSGFNAGAVPPRVAEMEYYTANKDNIGGNASRTLVNNETGEKYNVPSQTSTFDPLSGVPIHPAISPLPVPSSVKPTQDSIQPKEQEREPNIEANDLEKQWADKAQKSPNKGVVVQKLMDVLAAKLGLNSTQPLFQIGSSSIGTSPGNELWKALAGQPSRFNGLTPNKIRQYVHQLSPEEQQALYAESLK